MYRRGFATGVLLCIAATFLYQDCIDLLYYYMELLGPATTDSIKAGPFEITLSNATEWSTVAKMIVTVLATYAGIRVINKIFR